MRAQIRIQVGHAVITWGILPPQVILLLQENVERSVDANSEPANFRRRSEIAETRVLRASIV